MTASNNSLLINSLDDLKFYLVQGMKVEHATIPPYLTALYSLKSGTNIEAFQILRAVAVEEMLHLTLVANVYNAVGGGMRSTLTSDDFIPQYPTFLPTGATDFKVGLEKFSASAVETFMQIERTNRTPADQPSVIPRKQRCLISVKGQHESYSFYSIGEFYAEIIRGLFTLSNQLGEENLFCGDPQRQITPEYYYDGSGNIIPVTDRNSAIRALTIIQEQGEGSSTDEIFDAERNLSHYYRFQQLKLGRYYKVDPENPEDSDRPDCPTGSELNQEELNWDDVYPIKSNAKLSDYPQDGDLYNMAKSFQTSYREFLAKIEHAFDGHPETLLPAVGEMFQLKYYAEKIVRNPIPNGEGIHGAPIF
jgi:hypothetical protein